MCLNTGNKKFFTKYKKQGEVKMIQPTALMICKKIEHTLLKQATTEEITQLCQEAIDNKFRAVCVYPEYCTQCHELLKGTNVKIVSVIDFPNGNNGLVNKIRQAYNIIDDAHEIDVVINVQAWKDRYTREAKLEIRLLSQMIRTKVMLETGYLKTDQEIIELAKFAMNAGAFCVTTSTGFGPEVQLVEKAGQIYLIKKTIPELTVKASGGIKTKADAIMMIQAGADFIGTSSAMKIISEF